MMIGELGDYTKVSLGGIPVGCGSYLQSTVYFVVYITLKKIPIFVVYEFDYDLIS